ncbi:MAG TPA: alkaline phosphatase family protein, partial [Candidatus Krumholzibacteria bacterium]|nr:alkaline phosphatase family protein [Candidatus Krumholzibacteria bacterium]
TVNISDPRDWACDLAKEYGLRETVGWSIATNPLRDNVIDIPTFLEDLDFTLDNRKKVVMGELAKEDWDLFAAVFLSTDRMQHMMYRFIDPGHPNYDPVAAKLYGGQILKIYQKMDAIVGEVMDRYLDDNTTLIIVSDHGFHSFRYGVNLNTWLVKNGFMTLRGKSNTPSEHKKLDDLFDPEGSFFKNVDWPKTKAYSIGLGSIYVNLQLREPQGSVSASEYEDVRQGIIDGLKQLQDPRFPDTPVVLDVVRRDSVFHGPRFLEAPDLLVCFNENYRVSWQTALGGIPPDIIEDNMDNWSGDHCSYDPRITAGIFFCSRKLPDRPRSIQDIGPTVLRYLGIPLPGDFDGKPLQLSESK